MKRLITISNDSSRYYNYHSWMQDINAVLKKGNARVVSVTCTNDEYKNAVAYIEINEEKK